MAEYPSLPIPFPVANTPPDYGVIRTEMEQGYVQTRARLTKAPRKWRFSHVMLTSSEKSTWLAFWDSKKGGSASFSFTDPISGGDVSVRFAMKEPEVLLAIPGRWNINVELEEAL